MDKEAGKLLIKHIEAYPESFDMATWGKMGPCGTVACLAGHALLQAGYTMKSTLGGWGDFLQYIDPDGKGVCRGFGNEAQEILQMTDEERYDCGEPCADCDIFLDIPHGKERFLALLGDE